MKINQINVGIEHPIVLIAGPCVIESEKLVLTTAEKLVNITNKLQIPFVFKSSFDKANRTSSKSFRGLGIKVGLEILSKVKSEFSVTTLTDVHENTAIDEVSDVVDVLQTPAFLVRQTDFIQRVCKANLPVSIKKGQFMAPWEMRNVVDKALEVGNSRVMLCERGTSFGYNTLINDMRGLVQMRETGCPVLFDATHSVQQPGALGGKSGGQREFVIPLARAATAIGISGLFIETHPNPDDALSDGPNMLPLSKMTSLLEQIKLIDQQCKSFISYEDNE